jgi:hypothetical protein
MLVNNVRIGRGGVNVSANTALGYAALNLNTTGLGNTAVGFESLKSTNGNGNTAYGYQTMNVHTIGDGNTAFGANALLNASNNSQNTAVGNNALANNGIYSNTTGLGYNAQITASNQIALGDTAITSLRCNVSTITSLSDARDKKDILEISEGLEFISKLKPVTFTWNQRDGNRVGVKSAGFIAQDLLLLQNESLIGENLDLVSDSDPEQLEARYANLMPVMIKAIQELKAEIELLKMK